MLDRYMVLVCAVAATLTSAGAHPVRAQLDEQSSGGRLAYLEQFYKHFERGQADAVAAMLPRDMSWHMIGWREEVVPFAGEYLGRQQIRELLRDYFSEITVVSYQSEYQLSDATYTTWHFRLVGHVAATGKTFDAELVHLWRFDACENPVSLRSYMDTQLLVDAFATEGPTTLSDRKNLSDDYRVTSTPSDVEALVRTVYDKFYAGDIPGVLAMLSPDVAVYFQGHSNPQSGEYHGIQRVVEFITNLAGTARAGEITRFQVTSGDRTDVVLFENWTVLGTNKQYHVHTINSWRVDDEGRLLGFINYPDVDAVAAAYVP